MYDRMHVLVAAGGVAQYELNELAKQLKGAGMAWSTIDTFGQVLRLPKRHGKLPAHFWQDRVNMDDSTPIKCFASEALVAAPTLTLFVSAVVQPLGLLPDHCLCTQYLGDIMDAKSAEKRKAGRQRRDLWMLMGDGKGKRRERWET